MPDQPTAPPHRPTPATETLLARSRKELLDLSTRNRLLSIPVGARSARIIQIHDELSDQVFRLLVEEKKSLSFLPGRPSQGGEATPPGPGSPSGIDDEEIGLPQPEEEPHEGPGPARRHVDARLQTALSPEGLQARLLGLFRDAQTMIEEQGVNILYLALGHLKWLEAGESDTPRYAPLVLVPVEIRRQSASERFYMRWLEEDVQENLSLRAKLKADFNIDLPEFPEDEDFDLPGYFQRVAEAIQGAQGWEVRPHAITLGFFSFAKFLMFRDLDPRNWPEGSSPAVHPFVTALLQEGFPQSEPLLSDDANLDDVIPVDRLDHVVDADSSQTVAIEAVRQGRSLVIQGPPGTGKSQSIANIIATAVLDGKKVLFVAEKLAALEVVKRRLVKEGLGDLCLELHSNKSNKRAVVDEIGRTWKLGRPIAEIPETLVARLERQRSALNQHAQCLHAARPPSELSPYTVLGELARLGEQGREAADLTFAGAEQWTPEIRQECRKLIGELAERIRNIGQPSAHAWRGAGREGILNVDLGRIEAGIRTALASLRKLEATTKDLAEALGQATADTFQDAERQQATAQHVTAAPPADKSTLCHEAWDNRLDELSEMLEAGRALERAKATLAGRVVASAWEQDLSEARAHVAAHGASWFRIFNGDYRRALALLRGVSSGDFPKGYAARVAFADQVVAGQQAMRAIRAADSIGQAALGRIWRLEKTDWASFDAILAWVRSCHEAGLGADFRRLYVGIQDPARVGASCSQARPSLEDARRDSELLRDSLLLDCVAAFGAADLGTVSLQALGERLLRWLSQMEGLVEWSLYLSRANRARQLACGPLVERLESGSVDPGAALPCFDRTYYSQLIREFMRQNPALARFDGVLHDRGVEEFRQLDRERLALARHRVLSAHFKGMPPAAGVGPAGIVKGEMERKRGHRTVRRLLKDAGSIIQAVKPVFMMSPLSVAQFLEPGAVAFDLLVIDEASQVQPVDALGAITRCRQVVVVGDSRQMPPTRFFARMTSESDEADDPEAGTSAAEARDIESILGLCCARGLPQTMLRWHYRSRHHSLIAVSNQEFYGSQLFIVPSPQPSAAGLGLRFNPVTEGVFDSGASGTNRVEAKAVCRAVIEHARQSPELSLGVAAFSVRQQQAILDELELLRRENPETEPFFSSHPDEPFFIKNLENVQGDERDVIFISVGYGHDARGSMAMRFGPLSVEGGERRLNVLISRAKRRCEVFASIVAEDIDLERASGRGVAALRTFLNYAKNGSLDGTRTTDRVGESPFEDAVRTAIQSLGHAVETRVGVAGFFIDLAVGDSALAGHYLLGIECDGPRYHASRSARDRDRLRQAVLENHGWAIHRLWSTDWFQRPHEQLRKVQLAIEAAAAETRQRRLNTPAPPSPSPDVADAAEAVERETTIEPADAGLGALGTPYIEADFPVSRRTDPHEVSTRDLAEVVMRIVQLEGPIHEAEVVARVRDLWGLGRAGNRVQDSVAKAIRSLLVSRLCKREDECLSLPEAPVPIRNRAGVSSPGLRKPELLPPAEIRAAILALIDAHHGATLEEIPQAVARILGFKTTGSQLRQAIEAQVAKLLRQAVIADTSGMLKRAGSP